jgi:hypothetical protein
VSAAAVFIDGITPLAPLPPALATITPDFAWSPGAVPLFAQPVTYRLRIAHDSGLGAPIVDTVLAGELYALRRPLKSGAPLFWRVDATSATNVTASTGPVGPIAIPAWARLTALADSAGSATTEVQPLFTWSPVAITSPPGPFSYDLFVRRSTSQIETFSAGGLTDTTFRLPQPLERNATYRWELVVHAAADTSRVSTPAPFVVLDASRRPPRCCIRTSPTRSPRRPAPPHLVRPRVRVDGLARVLDLRGGVVAACCPAPISRRAAGRPVQARGPAAGLCDPRFAWDGRADDGRWLPAACTCTS